MQKIMKVLVFLLLFQACNAEKTNRGQAAQTAYGDDEQDAVTIVPQDSEDRIRLPILLFGAELECEKQVWHPAHDKIQCRVYSENFPLKLPLQELREQGYGLVWRYLGSSRLIELVNDLQDPIWQVEFRIAKSEPISSSDFRIEIYSSEQNQIFEKTSDALLAKFGWQELNSNPLPSNALISGHEGDPEISSLYACRMFVDDLILPGRLHSLDLDLHICRSHWNDLSILSHNAVAEQVYPTQVLISLVEPEDELLVWQNFANGRISDQPIISGYAPGFGPLYLCRSQEEEQILAGHIHAGRTNCSYEYFGIRSQAIYQVLGLANSD